MGDEGLRSVPQKPTVFANQTPLEDELVVLDFIQQFPSWGPERISRELARKGLLKIGHAAVYGISKRRHSNPDSKKTVLKISLSLAHILPTNGNFTENGLHSTLKTDCRRRLQTPTESGSGEPSHRNRYPK